MIVLYFGNELIQEDRIAVDAVERIKKELPRVNFVHCISPEEILSYDEAIILDVAKGIDKITIIDDLDKLKSRKTSSLHDFDLSFFLKLFRKTGKKIKIIALPDKNCDKELVNLLKSYTNSNSRK